MANIFSGSEIVEIAVQIEKNGKDFYDVLVDKIGDIKAKEVFKFLSDEEKNHITVFEKILRSVHKYEPKESYPEEYFAYMNALASEHVFAEKDRGKQVAENVASYKDAIDMGIDVEKDSILFYEGMKKVVSEHDHRIVDEVIAQEQEHLRQLWEVKDYLLKHPESKD